MRSAWRAVRVGLALIGLSATVGASTAVAQAGSAGDGRSLGGYGGSMSGTGPDMGTASSGIPYAGKFTGFMPSRMGGGGGLSFQARGTSAMGTGRTSFSLSPMSGGMSSTSGRMGGAFGPGPPPFSTPGSRGSMGPGGGMPAMTGPRGTGVMPPNFGYPFRQPPGLTAPASQGMGMSM